jgi:ubiquinone/menaquinone biosynthesis C-methylase UbiE
MSTADLDWIYSHLWSMHGDDFAHLDQSLGPRPPTMLIDLAATLGIGANHTVLDLGCGRGVHSLDLSRRFGCRVVGVDVVISRLLEAEVLPTDRVAYVNASAEAPPFPPAVFDLIWCRDMLVHVSDLRRCFAECRRCLKVDGRFLIFTTFATENLEPKEAGHLFRDHRTKWLQLLSKVL